MTATTSTGTRLQAIAEGVRYNIPVEDHKYRSSVYEQCFIASTLVEILIDHGFANDRQEAVQIGRSLQTKHHMFESSSSENYLFDDALLYFRLLDENRQKLLRKLDSISQVFRENIHLHDHKSRMTTYRRCFKGSEAVDSLIELGFASTRKAAVELGRSLQEDVRLFDHVSRDLAFSDDSAVFQFLKEEEKWKQCLDWTSFVDVSKSVFKVSLLYSILSEQRISCSIIHFFFATLGWYKGH